MQNDIVVYASLNDIRTKFTWLCPVSNICGEFNVGDYLPDTFPKNVPIDLNNFTIVDNVSEHRYKVVSPNPDKTMFFLDFSIAYDTLFPKQVQKPKSIEEYDLFMVQLRTTYTSEYSTRIFTDFLQAQDFFLQSKSEMIDDARSHTDYEVITDDNREICIEYNDRYQSITLEGIDKSCTDNELKRSFFKS